MKPNAKDYNNLFIHALNLAIDYQVHEFYNDVDLRHLLSTQIESARALLNYTNLRLRDPSRDEGFYDNQIIELAEYCGYDLDNQEWL